MWSLAEPIKGTEYLVGDTVNLSQIVREGHNPLVYFKDFETPIKAKDANILNNMNTEYIEIIMDYRELTGTDDYMKALSRYCFHGQDSTLNEWSRVLFPDVPNWVIVDWDKSIELLSKQYEVSKNGRVYRR